MAHGRETGQPRSWEALRERACRAWSAGPCVGLMAALLAVLLTACSARAVDPFGIEVAVEETRLAVDRMTDALTGLPPAVRDEVAAEVRLIAEAAHRTLDRIAMEPRPVADPELAGELSFVADLARAVAGELQGGREQDTGQAGGALLGRIDRLLGAADARLDRIDARVERWAERTRGAVVELESARGVLMIRRLDRMALDAVRYTGVGLLLIGVLVIGLRLLRMSEGQSEPFALMVDRPVVLSLAVLALGAFFVASLTFTISPGTLAALSAEVKRQPLEHPCLQVDRTRAQLAAAKAIGHASLIDAVKQRMVEPARDCLGLSSQAAATEAVTRLAARTGGDPSSAGLGPTGAQAGAPSASAAPGPAHEPVRTASRHLSAANAEPVDRTSRQGAAGRAAGERADRGSSVAVRDGQPPIPVLRAAAPRELVTTTKVNYRAAPRPDADRLGTLAPGTRVRVLGDANGWTEVRLNDGRKAFVASRFLEPAP